MWEVQITQCGCITGFGKDCGERRSHPVGFVGHTADSGLQQSNLPFSESDLIK